MRQTTLKFQAFRHILSFQRTTDSNYEQAFFALIEELRAEDLTPMTMRRLMLEAGMRPQRVNEAFRISRMGAIEYRRWKERFIGFQAHLSTIGKDAS